MSNELTDHELKAAMDQCAAEPVHVPGLVQPFGCLLAMDMTTGQLTYASENTKDILDLPASDFLGANAREILGRSFIHKALNGLSSARGDLKRASLGQNEVCDRVVETGVFKSGDQLVIEFENPQDPGLAGEEAIKLLSFLINVIQDTTDEKSLMSATVCLLRNLTGYDRVMAYKFDADYNGEIIAEDRTRFIEPFVGLRFPHWDIPAQARGLMKLLPVRFIEDVAQTPVTLWAQNEELPDLDITPAYSRGVSPVHMQYLSNMGVKATMTLSVVVDDQLWGMISFHALKPLVPPEKQRELLASFADYLSLKLKTLKQEQRWQMVSKVDDVKSRLLQQIENDEKAVAVLPQVGPTILDVMNADGIALLTAEETTSYGHVPSQGLLTSLLADALARPNKIIAIRNLEQRYPQHKDGCNGCAGALAAAINADRALCIFRKESAVSVQWAGNPSKTTEQVDGRTRLAPRGSFSVFLEEIDGQSEAWSEQDLYFAERIWALMNTAERRVLLNKLETKEKLGRQQALMIDELNHRVRNILALVRSVSQQSRRRYGTLYSYASAIESRILALAAAHDIASGSIVSAVSTTRLIEQELAPFGSEKPNYAILGDDVFLRADIAPMFALVVHELTTNAAKYGALSVDTGRVDVYLSQDDRGVSIQWSESGGPPVRALTEKGFGTVLIERSIPHEMDGEATLEFNPSGVEARLWLPLERFDLDATETEERQSRKSRLMVDRPKTPRLGEVIEAVWVVEDNFVIAFEMQTQLEQLGCENVSVFSSSEDALEAANRLLPDFAILDINLGEGKTSEVIATKLMDCHVPFVFITGYGNTDTLPKDFNKVPCLTKPVSNTDLQKAFEHALA